MGSTFITGTGRCGSTMLSNLINLHPEILSLSEFFAMTIGDADRRISISEAFTSELIDGREFWQLIARFTPDMDLLLRHDILFPEFLYPFKSADAKFNAQTGIPVILQITLPHLTKDHDQLYLALGKFIQEQPKEKIRWHYDTLFNWLKERLGKRVWVERSGYSLDYVEEFYSIFPDARFIHILRDGRNAAISMSRHVGFCNIVITEMLTKHLGVNPYTSQDRSKLGKLPLELRGFLPEGFDREAFLRFQAPLESCGRVWSEQIEKGLKFLNQLPDGRVLTLSYEEFCENPASRLEEITDFIGVESRPDWLQRVTEQVRRSPTSWCELPVEQQAILHEACRPGMELLQQQFDSYAKALP